MKDKRIVLVLLLAVFGCATVTSAPVRGKGVVVSYSTEPNTVGDAAKGAAVGATTGGVIALAGGVLLGPIGVAAAVAGATTGALAAAVSGKCGDGWGYLTFIDANGQTQETKQPRRLVCNCQSGDEMEYMLVGLDNESRYYPYGKNGCVKKASTDKEAS